MFEGAKYGLPLRPLLSNPGIPGTVLVPLTRGRYAIIDTEDSVAVAQHNWHCRINKNKFYAGYVKRQGERMKYTQLHRFLWTLWKMPPSAILDHRNGDGLDCRRANVRAATSSQNCFNACRQARNTTGYRGVWWNRSRNRYQAVIHANGVGQFLGNFATKEEAALAYAAAARKLHGEYAHAELLQEVR
jgi:AP2 domain.